ncbi:MAG: DUF481 domain-containing protein [Myxococcota bacterium]
MVNPTSRSLWTRTLVLVVAFAGVSTAHPLHVLGQELQPQEEGFHPEVAPDTVTSELGKEDSLEPSTTVKVTTQDDLPDEYMIEFGDDYDWIQMKSGEWLKGNLERMRDGALDFDSAELRLLTLDWKKTMQLHSPTANTFVFSDGTELVGPAMIDQERVAVQTTEGLVIRDRAELSAIIEHTQRERNYWSTVLRLGLTANAGNSEQLTFNAFWSLVREDALTRAQLTYDGTFGRIAREQSANRHLGTGDVDIFVHPILYVKALTGQLLYDRFQNIRLRATPAAGVGVHVITTYVVNWDFEVAPGYQYLSLLDPADTVEDPQSDFYLGLRMFADLDFTDDIQLLLDWRTNLVLTRIGNTNHTGSLDFSIRVTSIFDTNISFLFLRTEDPFPRSDGTVPKSNDYQIVVGVSLRLG